MESKLGVKNNELNKVTNLNKVRLSAKKIFTIEADKINEESPISYNERIDERIDVFDTIFSDEHDYNILANMGGGKTTGIINYIYKQDLRGVITVPLKINAEQIADYFKNFCEIELGYIHGDVKDNQIAEYINNPSIKVIACVYDSLDRLTKFEGFKPEECFLIIDEIHNLSIQYEFRYTAIRQLNVVKNAYKKIISLTGTPEGTLYNKARNIHFQTSLNSNDNKKNVILTHTGNSSIKKFGDTVLKFAMKGKCVIFLNDKPKVEQLAKHIRRHLPTKTSSAKTSRNTFTPVETLYSVNDKKDKRKFNKKLSEYLISHGEIPNEVDYLITTSILSDGVNIMNTNIDKVLIFNVNDMWVKRQYIARFRNGVNEVIDFSLLKKEENCRWFDLKLEFSKRFELLEKYRTEMEKLKNERIKFGNSIGLSNIEMIPLPKENDFIFYDKKEKTYTLSRERVALSIIKDLNEIMYNDYSKALEFYKDIAGYNIIHKYYYELLTKEESGRKNSTELSQEEKVFFRKEFKKFFKLYFDEEIKNNVLTQYIQKDYFPSNEFDKNHFRKLNERYFLNDLTMKLLEDIFNLSILYYPFCVADKFIELRFKHDDTNARKLIWEIQCNAFFKLKADMLKLEVRDVTSELFKREIQKFKLVDLIYSVNDQSRQIINYGKLLKIVEREFTNSEIKSALRSIFNFTTREPTKEQLWRYKENTKTDDILDRFGIDSNQYGHQLKHTYLLILKKEIDNIIVNNENHNYTSIMHYDLKKLKEHFGTEIISKIHIN